VALLSPLVIRSPASFLPITRCTSNSPARTGLRACTTAPLRALVRTCCSSIGTSITRSPGRMPGSIDPLVIMAARHPRAVGATAQKSRPASIVSTDNRTIARTVDNDGTAGRIRRPAGSGRLRRDPARRGPERSGRAPPGDAGDVVADAR
jgi:hypothetical protein